MMMRMTTGIERLMPEGMEWPRCEDGRLVDIGSVRTFGNVRQDKAQALKVLEEAAEVVEAWKDMERERAKCLSYGNESSGDGDANAMRECLLDECADVIQATCNLIAALGVYDFTEYMWACEDRNRERGRYVPMDVDGVAIKVGDEVMLRNNGRKGVVRGFDDSFAIVEYDARDVNGGTMTVKTEGACLTHVMNDSWERIEDDARGLDSGVDRELSKHTHEDLVSRCKALAERGR